MLKSKNLNHGPTHEDTLVKFRKGRTTHLVPSATEVPDSTIAIQGWEDILNAMKAQLGQIIFVPDDADASAAQPPTAAAAAQHEVDSARGELVTDPYAAQAFAAANRIRERVRTCLAALDQLRTTLESERTLRQQAGLDALDADERLERQHVRIVRALAGEDLVASTRDPLSGLLNRARFNVHLEQMLAYAKPELRSLAVLHLDLDGFSQIIQEHGENAGNEVIRMIAKRLTSSLRAGDVLGRIGRDEFVCLIGGFSDHLQLGSLATELFAVVSAPMEVGQAKISVRPSIGIAFSPNHGTNAHDLTECAKIAMLRAKRAQSGHEILS